ncbi:MAG: hypothetical protein ACXWNR_05010 [Candidatus Limnocylindrales bacterium]
MDTLVGLADRSRRPFVPGFLACLAAAAEAEPASRRRGFGPAFFLFGLLGLAFGLAFALELVFARLEAVELERLFLVLIAVRHALASLLCGGRRVRLSVVDRYEKPAGGVGLWAHRCRAV